MNKRQTLNYEVLNPYRIIRTLPNLSRGVIEPDILGACPSAIPAWQLLEDGVFFFFRQILNLETIKLGADCLFERDPEGIVLIDGHPTNFALIYECKSREHGYAMSSDDVLRYKEYVKSKKHEIRVKYHLALTHFVIVSSLFHGDFKSKIEEISADGTIVCLLPASELVSFYEKASGMDVAGLQLIDYSRVFCTGLFSSFHLKTCLSKLGFVDKETKLKGIK